MATAPMRRPGRARRIAAPFAALALALAVSTGAHAFDPGARACDFSGYRALAQIDYEAGLVSERGRYTAHPPPRQSAIAIDERVVREGRRSLRTEIGPGPEYQSFGATRAESSTIDGDLGRYGAHDRRAYAFSFRLEPGWVFDAPESIDAIWQFKRGGARPDVFVAVKGSALVLRSYGGVQKVLVSSLEPGRWYDACLRIDWSTEGDGAILASARPAGESEPAPVVVDGPNLGAPAGGVAYAKWGLYKPGPAVRDGAAAHVIRHDALRFLAVP